MAPMVDQAIPVAPDLRTTDFPAEFTPGARNAVTTCLRIQPNEKVTLITDERCLTIAASLASELDRVGCEWNAFVLESLAPRPLMRHAHMVNITPEIMTQGMRADFLAIDRLSQAVLDKVRAATYVRATTPAGTDIHTQLNPEYRWFKTSGIISTEKWGNLPGGECFTAPGEVNGVFVVDGVVGDFLCARYGILRAQPLTINIEGNRITRVSSENKALE